MYSAPGGKFKAHVDTPRNKDQIGSLVVSLPSAHQGGQLSVNNAGAGGQNVVFDWSSDETEPGEIKWAAFYSDCEHEVHEVTSGHRVTLTYNLFLTRVLDILLGIHRSWTLRSCHSTRASLMLWRTLASYVVVSDLQDRREP